MVFSLNHPHLLRILILPSEGSLAVVMKMQSLGQCKQGKDPAGDRLSKDQFKAYCRHKDHSLCYDFLHCLHYRMPLACKSSNAPSGPRFCIHFVFILLMIA